MRQPSVRPHPQPWPDDSWKGWWGRILPYHVPTFVLTRRPRADPMKGGTVFHFVTEGINAALGLARQAASGEDLRIGGGASTSPANTSRPDWWTGCAWPSHLFSLALAFDTSQKPTSMSWGTSAWSESREQATASDDPEPPRLQPPESL